MSKSLKRVRAALESAGVPVDVRETALARTAQDAAIALGCAVDQIAKSIVLQTEGSDEAVLFITAGGHQVDLDRAAALAGGPLGKRMQHWCARKPGLPLAECPRWGT